MLSQEDHIINLFTPTMLVAVVFIAIIATAPVAASAYLGEGPPPAFEPVWVLDARVALVGGGGAPVLVFSPSGDMAAYSSIKAVYIIDTVTGSKSLAYRTEGYDGIKALAFSPDGRRLALGHTIKGVTVLDVEDLIVGPKKLCNIDFDLSVTALAYTQDGARIVAGMSSVLSMLSASECKALWRINTDKPIGLIKTSGNAIVTLGCSSSPCGPADASSRYVRVYTLDGRKVWGLELNRPVRDVEIDNSKNYIYVGTSQGAIMAYRPPSGKPAISINLGNSIVDLELLSNGRLAVLLANGTILHIDVRHKLITWRGSPPAPLKLGPKNGVLAPNGKSYIVYMPGSKPKLIYVAPVSYGLITIRGDPGAVVTVEGPGGRGVFRIREGEPLRLYATPGRYVVKYSYERLPYQRLIFNMSNTIEGKIEVVAKPNETSEIRIPGIKTAYATLVIDARRAKEKYTTVRITPEYGVGTTEIVVRAGERRVYLIDPMRYTFGIDDVKRAYDVKPGDIIVLNVTGSADTSKAGKHTTIGNTKTVTTQHTQTSSHKVPGNQGWEETTRSATSPSPRQAISTSSTTIAAGEGSGSREQAPTSTTHRGEVYIAGSYVWIALATAAVAMLVALLLIGKAGRGQG